ERVVPDPPPVAAGVGHVRVEAEALADPARRLVDGAVVLDAEVVDLVAAGAGQQAEDRRDTVGDVEVALALLAVAEDGERGGVLAARAHERDDMAVGAAGGPDREEGEG